MNLNIEQLKDDELQITYNDYSVMQPVVNILYWFHEMMVSVFSSNNVLDELRGVMALASRIETNKYSIVVTKRELYCIQNVIAFSGRLRRSFEQKDIPQEHLDNIAARLALLVFTYIE